MWDKGHIPKGSFTGVQGNGLLTLVLITYMNRSIQKEGLMNQGRT